MSLRSGLASCVPWALNVLALASFQTRPELLLPGLPGLLPALLQVCPLQTAFPYQEKQRAVLQ